MNFLFDSKELRINNDFHSIVYDVTTRMICEYALCRKLSPLFFACSCHYFNNNIKSNAEYLKEQNIVTAWHKMFSDFSDYILETRILDYIDVNSLELNYSIALLRFHFLISLLNKLDFKAYENYELNSTIISFFKERTSFNIEKNDLILYTAAIIDCDLMGFDDGDFLKSLKCLKHRFNFLASKIEKIEMVDAVLYLEFSKLCSNSPIVSYDIDDFCLGKNFTIRYHLFFRKEITLDPTLGDSTSSRFTNFVLNLLEKYDILCDEFDFEVLVSDSNVHWLFNLRLREQNFFGDEDVTDDGTTRSPIC